MRYWGRRGDESEAWGPRPPKIGNGVGIVVVLDEVDIDLHEENDVVGAAGVPIEPSRTMHYRSGIRVE